MLEARDTREPDRFFDVESGGTVRLDLQLRPDGRTFVLLRRFGYWDPKHDRPFVVPADVEQFTTDLVSVPQLVSWLVPKVGSHLAPALLHDGLVLGAGEKPTYEGDTVDREEADRIFRDAMKHQGTPVLRRWLIWAAVSVATRWHTSRAQLWWRALVLLSTAGIAVLGVLATLDLFDVVDPLPWMGPRSWRVELAGGALFATLVPLALSVLWGRRWKAGVITGLSVAFLVHVMVAVLLVYGLYLALDAVCSFPEGNGPSIDKNLEKRTGVSAPPTQS